MLPRKMEKKQNKQNNLMTILGVGLIIALFLIVGQSYLLTGNSDVNEQISVSGKSEVKVSPDKAEIYLSISTVNIDAKIAQSTNKELSTKVIDALVAQGVDKKDIETINFRLNEKYEPIYRDNDVKDKETKYEARHTLKIKTTDLDSVGNIVDTAIKAGANGVDSVNYVLSDEKEKTVRAEALEKAILVGKQKAEAMTKTLDVELSDVISISENNYYYQPFRSTANLKMEMADSVDYANGNFFAPQDVEVSSTVNLVFEIEN